MKSSFQGDEKGVAYWERKSFPWLVFGSFALLYLVNRSPFVGFNDGLTFLYSASHGFDFATNATSHFLYNNLLHVLAKVFFFLPDVFVLTVFSVCCGLGTLGFVYRMGRLLTANRGLALLPVVVLGVSFTFWQQTEIIEVYAFNNLLFSAFLYISIKDLLEKNRNNYLFLSLLLGFGLITHIQHILSIPFFIFYLWWRNELRIGQKILGMLPWMGLMSILFVLPAFTHLHSWKAVFIESKFQDDLFVMSAMAMLKGLALGVGMLLYNFHLALVPIGLGWRKMWAANRPMVLWLALLGLPYLAFALKYSVNDNHVFYLCFYIVMVVPVVYWLGNESAAKLQKLRWMLPMAALAPICLYAGATLLAHQVPALKQYDEEKAYKGGVTHLLWPGKAWAKDPLEIAWQEAHFCRHNPANRIDEWNFEAAIHYLKRNCQTETPEANGWTIYPPLSALVDSCFFNCPELLNLMQNFRKE